MVSVPVWNVLLMFLMVELLLLLLLLLMMMMMMMMMMLGNALPCTAHSMDEGAVLRFRAYPSDMYPLEPRRRVTVANT